MTRKALYVASIFLAFHLYLIIYINSSYLGVYFSPKFLSVLFILGAAANLVLLINASRLIQKFGSSKLILTAIVLEFIALAGLASGHYPALIATCFILYGAVSMFILFILDIFLESVTQEEKTGGVRALYLTISNVILVISPSIVSLLLSNNSNSFWKVYIISAALLIPLYILIKKHFGNFVDTPRLHVHPRETIAVFQQNPDIRRITLAHLILECFYAWMVIYMPLYLYEHVGFSWQTIGIIFTCMLLPFILIEIPAGTVSDKKFGEKELLTLGFIICAISTAIIPFITSANIFIWIAVLFTTRVGASLVEITTESYFFKHVNSTNPDVISYFRATRPVAYILIPLLVLAILSAIEFKYIFFILSFIVLLGAPVSLLLKDTK